MASWLVAKLPGGEMTGNHGNHGMQGMRGKLHQNKSKGVNCMYDLRDYGVGQNEGCGNKGAFNFA